MGVWAERVVPRLTDVALDNKDIGELRAVACLGLHGRVVEIGFGSGLDGQRIDVEDASYDAALATFTLCTIPDAAVALAEVRRVLRPGGLFHFLEHGLAPDAAVVTWQHRLEPLQRRVFAGCHLTRDVPALLADAGLEITLLQQRYLPGPAISRPWTYAYLGRAVRPG